MALIDPFAFRPRPAIITEASSPHNQREPTMPPKQGHKKASGTPSKSSALVTTGPKEVVVKTRHHGRKLDANGMRPTTSRALVLRNGKQGAMGSGEMVLSQKISGREKLELLAGVFSFC